MTFHLDGQDAYLKAEAEPKSLNFSSIEKKKMQWNNSYFTRVTPAYCLPELE